MYGNLGLSVINYGEYYVLLKRHVAKCHSGEWTKEYAIETVSNVCRLVGRTEAKHFEQREPNKSEIRKAAEYTLDWHLARIADEPPAYKWQVTRGDGRIVRFLREQDAFAYILNNQSASVHHATTYEGWSYGPIEG